jgi:pyruvate dehydrogenase E1 component
LFPAHQDSGLRENVIRGAYRLVDRSRQAGYEPGINTVNLFASGPVVPEAIEASDALLMEGIHLNVFNVTGPGPLYRDFQEARSGKRDTKESHLESLIPHDERVAPVVTVVDDHPHALAWIGGALGAMVHPLGVSRFGQSGNRVDLYREYGIDRAHIEAACRRALGLEAPVLVSQ